MTRPRLIGIVTTALHDLLAERGVMLRTNATHVMDDTRRAILAAIRDEVPRGLRPGGVPQLAAKIAADARLAGRVAAAASPPPSASTPMIGG